MTPGTCQNLRSAPQKQPSPNIAFSAPCGVGALERGAVHEMGLRGGNGLARRPGSAWSGEGMDKGLRFRVLLPRSYVLLLAAL